MLSQAGKLRLAAARGDVGQVGELIRAKVPVTADQEGRSAFHHAAACGHTQIVKMILDNQLSPVNQTDGGGKTALHLAAAGGHMQCTQVLISLGADVNQRERLNLNSPLHEAAYNGFSMTVDILCRAGSDANATNRQQSTPLHLSAQAGHNQCARVLLCGGSNPALPNTYGDSPLHTACRYGHAGVSRILLSAHPLTPVNMRNKNGDTALHIAAALRRKKIIKLLLECGAELHHKNQQGETPVDVAKRKGHTDVVDLLWQPATFPGGLMLSAAGSISTLPKVAAAGSGAVGHYAVSAVDPASQQQQQQQQLTAAAAPNLKLRQQPALLMNQPVLEAPQQQQQQQQHYHVPLQLHQQQQQQQQQHQQHQHQNQRFEISPASSSEPKEGTPKLEDQHTQQQQQQQHKKKRKFSLFKLFRKKSKERSIDPSATYANGGLTDVGPSSTTEAAPVPAVAASYHQHLGNGGQLLRPQVTSQCTCHVRVTSAASAAADQSRISHCILHGHREWHGVDSSTRTKITFGPPTAAARSTPPAEGATAAVHESLSYQQLFPISNPYHTSPIAGTGAAGDQQPRLYRTRSDESLSMSEFKVKTQKEKLRAYHDRQETWRAAAASAGAPQTGRRGAYQQQQQQQQSPGPQPAYSKPTAPPLSAGRPSGLTVQLVASQSPLQFRASPDGAQQQPQHQHLHHHHHHHLQFQHPQHHQQVEGEQTSLPAPVPPRRFDAGAPTGGGGAVNFGVRWQRSATPDSEIRARNRQAAEKLQQFRSVYNRGAAGAPAAATAAAAAAAAAGSAAVPSAGIASQSPQLPRNLQTNKSGALMTTHV